MREKEESSQSRRKILFTGARGIIGSRIVPEFRKIYDVMGTDLSPLDQEDYVPADLTDFGQTFALMEGVDTVVHLAAATGAGRLANCPEDQLDPVDERMLRVNPASVYHVMEAATRRNVRRVVYISSLTIALGDKDRPSYPDGMPPDPTNLYACTKLFGEHIAYVQWKRAGLSCICLRLGQPTPIDSELDELWQHSRRARSWRVHLVDAIAGICAAIETSTPFGVYNLVSDSDNPRVDLEPIRRDLGYCPRAFFGENSLTIRNA